MAKRELIDREKAENTTWEEPSYTDALNVLTEVRDKIRETRDKIRELPVITEQEIVKAVLDKIITEIIAESFPEDEENSFCKIIYLKDVLDIIDKYKAGSEDK